MTLVICHLSFVICPLLVVDDRYWFSATKLCIAKALAIKAFLIGETITLFAFPPAPCTLPLPPAPCYIFFLCDKRAFVVP